MNLIGELLPFFYKKWLYSKILLIASKRAWEQFTNNVCRFYDTKICCAYKFFSFSDSKMSRSELTLPNFQFVAFFFSNSALQMKKMISIYVMLLFSKRYENAPFLLCYLPPWSFLYAWTLSSSFDSLIDVKQGTLRVFICICLDIVSGILVTTWRYFSYHLVFPAQIVTHIWREKVKVCSTFAFEFFLKFWTF